MITVNTPDATGHNVSVKSKMDSTIADGDK